jgi:purine-binding chemotaxis protein CheW
VKAEENIIKEKKVIAFQIKNEEYALAVDQVNSIERMMPITRVPHTSRFIKGVINLRGVVLPVIDLRARLGMEVTEYNKQTRIIIVETSDIEIGLIVDAANDVISISDDEIEEVQDALNSVHANYIEGILKLDERLLVLLDLEKVLADPEVDMKDKEPETQAAEEEAEEGIHTEQEA